MKKTLKTCFAIVSGEYSDYRVLGVCDDEKTAVIWAVTIAAKPGGWNSDARVQGTWCAQRFRPAVREDASSRAFVEEMTRLLSRPCE